MNTLQLTDEQVEALQSIVAHGLPYARASLEQACIAEAAHYCKHHTDFDDLRGIIQNYDLLIEALNNTAALIQGE